jgi:hypothetical protein
MKIGEAISRIDTLKPNTIPKSEKIKWLSTLDSMVTTEIIQTHEGGENTVFIGYDESTFEGTELLIPSPYDDAYLYWLESKIDYWNGESNKYNNSTSMFNAVYLSYAKRYNKKHMPKGKRLRLF